MADIIANAEDSETPQSDYANERKIVDELLARQQRRKLKSVTSFAKEALWFCESFGLKPVFLQVQKNHKRKLSSTSAKGKTQAILQKHTMTMRK